MENYLKSWLVERQERIPFNVKDVSRIVFNRETIDHLFCTLISPDEKQRVVFIKNPVKCEVVGMYYNQKGKRILVQ